MFLISSSLLPDFSARAFAALSIASLSFPQASVSLSIDSTASFDKSVYSATYSVAPDVVNFFKVSVRTSDVNHPVFNDSLKDPSAAIAAFAPVLSFSEVSVNAS